MSDHECPQCRRGKLRRSERRGFWERHVLSLFGMYPWRCGFCRARTSIKDRGPQRHYVQSHRLRQDETNTPV